MFGQMMKYPLLITSFIDRAANLFPNVEVVSRLGDRSLHRYTYKECRDRAYRLAAVLQKLGIEKGDRVGTLMWNHYAHMEAYFGIPLSGGVLHTLNLRLHPQEIARIVKHAGDRIVIVDDALLPLWEKVAPHFRPERVIVVSICGQKPEHAYDNYEDLLATYGNGFKRVEADENDAVGLCYTSGTTGFPKGVLYSHRSIALHSLALVLPDALGLRQQDVLLPVVPMFHVNGWGLPFAAAMLGMKFVLPGPCLDCGSVLDLFASERVTFSAGVPTIWMNMLRELEARPDLRPALNGMRMLVGGSAIPESLILAFKQYGAQIIQGWGLTETSPLATIGLTKPHLAGIPVPFIDLRTVNADGLCPKDGETMGEVQVRGPWVASGYFAGVGEPSGSEAGATPKKWTDDGWFCTGDVGVLDADGCLRITDRTKDLIKSGGEWISSVDLETALMSHPRVQEAAVIAIPDEKWQERPLAVVVLKPNAAVSPDDLCEHISTRFPKWWLPEQFVFVKEIPRTSTGKFLKTKLREMYKNGALLS
jgi:fatty-acyl-CoA synthase